jgi:hypothetical protein
VKAYTLHIILITHAHTHKQTHTQTTTTTTTTKHIIYNWPHRTSSIVKVRSRSNTSPTLQSPTLQFPGPLCNHRTNGLRIGFENEELQLRRSSLTVAASCFIEREEKKKKTGNDLKCCWLPRWEMLLAATDNNKQWFVFRLSPITLAKLSCINLVSIFRWSSPPWNPVYTRCVQITGGESLTHKGSVMF